MFVLMRLICTEGFRFFTRVPEDGLSRHQCLPEFVGLRCANPTYAAVHFLMRALSQGFTELAAACGRNIQQS
jgi:hypothetical protein